MDELTRQIFQRLGEKSAKVCKMEQLTVMQLHTNNLWTFLERHNVYLDETDIEDILSVYFAEKEAKENRLDSAIRNKSVKAHGTGRFKLLTAD